jgi:hypothetical protein
MASSGATLIEEDPDSQGLEGLRSAGDPKGLLPDENCKPYFFQQTTSYGEACQ